ncbi:MAG: redoxin domain-containing protein [Microgenomates group bacterium]
MTSKEKLVIAITTEVLVTIVVVALIFRGPGKVAGQTVSAPTPTPTRIIQNSSMQAAASSGDGMHGAPKPADTTVFNSLLNNPAPDFTLESYDGRKITLSQLKGKNVVLFFNEGIMCYPACWNQIAAFGKDKEFAANGTVVLNINVDAKNDWAGAVKKMPELAAGTVLLDNDRKVSTAYGVLTTESSMHRGQYPGHSYVIIDKEGVVRFVWDDPQMAVRNREILVEVAKL